MDEQIPYESVVDQINNSPRNMSNAEWALICHRRQIEWCNEVRRRQSLQQGFIPNPNYSHHEPMRSEDIRDLVFATGWVGLFLGLVVGAVGMAVIIWAVTK